MSVSVSHWVVAREGAARVPSRCHRFQLVSVSLNYQLVSVSFKFSFFILVYCYIDFRYDYDNDRFQVSSYRYVSLSVSKLRSLERGGMSELSQAQVDR